MATINIDVIALVIDNVQDDRGTLFSLLTVNKQVFRYTCAVLYRDPFRFFRNKHRHDKSLLENRMSLLWLLMSLSPAVDDDTNRVRRALDVALKRGPEARAWSETEAWPVTKLDYLSFIRCVRFHYSLKAPESRCTMMASDSFAVTRIASLNSIFRSTVTWSICGHRLDQLYELEIEARAIERFVEVAPQLCRLRIIVIGHIDTDFRSNVVLLTTTYPSAVRLLQAFQHHHGMDQLLDFRFTDASKVSEDKTFFQWNIAIRKMLPPLLPRDLKLTHPLRPMDSYLSRLTELRTENNRTFWWKEISKEYTDVSVGHLLQRCRRLDMLVLDFIRGGIDDASVFAWAVDERRDREAGRLLAPAVPLKSLNLKLAGVGSEDTSMVLIDGIRAFGPSLHTLEVKSDPLKKGMMDERLWRLPLLQDESMMMPRLRIFRFISPVVALFDVRFLHSSPDLTTLVVSFENRRAKLAPVQVWPVLQLPHLTSLKLCGLAVALFNPASLHGMPQLQSIEFFSHGADQRAPDGRPTMQDNWTWDWDLPKLKDMTARMNLSKAKFSFRFLRGCPNLSNLLLDFINRKPAYPLDVSSVLGNSTQDVYPNLLDIQLVGKGYTLELEDLRILSGRAFPSLERFHVTTVVSCTREQVEEVIRDFRTRCRSRDKSKDGT